MIIAMLLFVASITLPAFSHAENSAPTDQLCMFDVDNTVIRLEVLEPLSQTYEVLKAETIIVENLNGTADTFFYVYEASKIDPGGGNSIAYFVNTNVDTKRKAEAILQDNLIRQTEYDEIEQTVKALGYDDSPLSVPWQNYSMHS